MTVRKAGQARRGCLVALSILFVLVLVVVLVSQFTPVLSAVLLRQLINASSFSAPPNFDAIQANVVAKTGLVYDGQEAQLDLYIPQNAKTPLPVVLWIHGGGFIGGKKEQARAYAMTLANAGYLVAAMDYDLAPAHHYPRPVIQSNQALGYLQEIAGQYGGDTGKFFLGSNSSGSQIASQVAAVISDEQYARSMGIQPAITREQLKGALLYDGAYDMHTLKAAGAPGMSLFFWSYTGVKDIETFDRAGEMSAVEHITPEYPPVFLAVGDADRLEPQTLEFMQVLKDNHVEVEAVLYTGTGAGLGHDYMMELDTQPAQQTLARAVDFLSKHSR